jgi:multiple sugar transport system ATP-binding protein
LAGVPLGLRVVAGGAGPLTLALRPEDLRPGAEGLPATAEHLEFLGDGLLLHARHEPDGAPLIARLPKGERDGVAAGQRLRLRFPPARALLFGPEGRRVPARVVADPAALAAA